MQRFTKSIENAINEKNWYAALGLALALPDICGKACFPGKKNKDRYVMWYDKYMLSKYTSTIGARSEKHVFLTGKDCFALRCALLHAGSDDISQEKAKEVIESFNFLVPLEGREIHKNQKNSVLQLQVDIFCRDICSSVHQCLEENSFSNGEFDKLLTINNICAITIL